jgi:1-deoxy-D-xylulose-5-phosphate synthase
MMREMPDRCFDVGIAEGHAVTFSAGMAAAGYRPVCNIYSSFMQRAYDNLIHDVALQKLPVVMCLDRAGIVGEDGATHHGAFDLAYLGCIPNIVVAAPRNEWLLRQMLHTAINSNYPTVIRYPRGIGEGVEWENTPFTTIEIGRGEQLREGDDVAILAIGPMANVAMRAAGRSSRSVAVYDMRYAKPLDIELINSVASHHKHIITIEDGVVRGGVGEAIASQIAKMDYTPTIQTLGIDDRFVEHGKPQELYAECGYDEEALLRHIEDMLS